MNQCILRARQYIAEKLGTDDIYNRLIHNTGWLFRSTIITTGLRFVQAIVLARFLGPENFGIYATITTSTIVINQLTSSRVWEMSIKFTSKYLEQGDKQKSKAMIRLSYLIDTATGVLAFLILFLVAGPISRLLIKDPSFIQLVRIYALWNIATIPIDSSTAILRIADQFKELAYYNIAEATLRLSAILFAIASFGTLDAILIAMLVSTTSSSLLILIQVFRAMRSMGLSNWQRASLSPLASELGSIFRFTITSNLNDVLKLLKRNVDVLLVGYLMGPTHAGFVKFARSVSDLLGFPIGPFYAASYPEFVRLWHKGARTKLKQFFLNLTIPSILYGFVALISVGLLAPFIIRIIGGGEYIPAISTLQWFAVGAGLSIALNFGHPLLTAIGAIHWSVVAQSAGIIAQIMVLIALIPITGSTAAGQAFMIANLLWMVITTLTIYRTLWTQTVQEQPEETDAAKSNENITLP